MAKMTLLEIVQDILNDIDGDEVNSIDDTSEASQVAQIVKTTFNSIMSDRDWPHTKGLFQLIPSTDPALPTHMTFEENIKKIVLINYDKVRLGETRRKYGTVKWVDTDEFLRMSNSRNSEDITSEIIVDPSGIELVIRNDVPPTYYTSFDDETLVFDSYDQLVDDTLKQHKFQAMGYTIPGFTMVDEFIPDLPTEAFIYLLEESKSRSAIKVRQAVDEKAEQISGQQKQWLSRNAWTVNKPTRYPNYGRRARTHRKDVTFTQGREI